MGAAISGIVSPFPSSIQPAGKRRDGLFSLSLLVLAMSFLWLSRTYGPVSMQRWFNAVPLQQPLDLLLLLAALLTAMLVHELGHLALSHLLGFHILGGSIGPIQIQSLPGTWKLSWSKQNFFTGSVSAIPRTTNYWRQAMMLVVAAGPLATLASGLFVAMLDTTDHSLVVLQVAFVQISILLFFLGLIPNGRHARQHNDARIFLDLALRNDGADEMELKVLLKQQLLDGIRPQDYPAPLMHQLARFEARAETRLLFALAVVDWAIDSDEIRLADTWDKYAMELAHLCGGKLRNTAFASSGCFDVIFRSDLASAQIKFGEVDYAALFPACFEQRVRAASQIAAGRTHRAPGHILQAQYALPVGIPHYEFDRMLLAMLHMIALAATPVRHAKFKTASV